MERPNFTVEKERDARLRILQAIAREPDERLSDYMLVRELETWGHERSMSFVRLQLARLAELRAVILVSQNEAMWAAQITPAGREHVQRISRLPEVRWPEHSER